MPIGGPRTAEGESNPGKGSVLTEEMTESAQGSSATALRAWALPVSSTLLVDRSR